MTPQAASSRTIVGALLSVTGVGLSGAGVAMLVQGSATAEPTDKVYVCKYVTQPDPDGEIIKPGKNPIVVAEPTLGLEEWPGTFPWEFFADGQFRSVAIGFAGGDNPVLTEADCPLADTDPTTDVPTTDVPTTDVPTTDVPTTDVPTTDVPPSQPPAGVVETTRPPRAPDITKPRAPEPPAPSAAARPNPKPAPVAPAPPKAVAAGAGDPDEASAASALVLAAGGGLLAAFGAVVALGGRRPRDNELA